VDRASWLASSVIRAAEHGLGRESRHVCVIGLRIKSSFLICWEKEAYLAQFELSAARHRG